MMNRIKYFVIAFFVLAIGFSSSYWVNKPIQVNAPRNNSLNNCAACHENSISQDAWQGIPDWHNKKFCNPILNAENREEHRREAYGNRKKCMTCHMPDFQVKCANCHLQSEW